MNLKIDFSGPLLKAERSEQHIRQLEDIFGRHIRSNNKALIPNKNRSRRVRAIGSPLPKHTPTILGDALHNMRAALDHAYCILVKANGGIVDDFTRFPFCRDADWKSLKGSIDGHAKSGRAPSATVIDHIFTAVQPYLGGNGDDLLSIHRLDIADKHMMLLPADQMVNVENLEFSNDSRISGITFVGGGSGSALLMAPGIQPVANPNAKVSFEICFGRGQPLEGKPIIPTLKRLLVRVRETIENLASVAN